MQLDVTSFTPFASARTKQSGEWLSLYDEAGMRTSKTERWRILLNKTEETFETKENSSWGKYAIWIRLHTYSSEVNEGFVCESVSKRFFQRRSETTTSDVQLPNKSSNASLPILHRHRSRGSRKRCKNSFCSARFSFLSCYVLIQLKWIVIGEIKFISEQCMRKCSDDGVRRKLIIWKLFPCSENAHMPWSELEINLSLSCAEGEEKMKKQEIKIQ